MRSRSQAILKLMCKSREKLFTLCTPGDVTNYLFSNNPQYQLLNGGIEDRAKLLGFLQLVYQELYPQQQSYIHLESTVDRYLSSDTPLWFVTVDSRNERLLRQTLRYRQRDDSPQDRLRQGSGHIGCLWLGMAIDQITGIRHPNIFLLYVDPSHRRQGIGRELMRQAEVWAKLEGYSQISLQVFTTNQPALDLYGSLGYEARSISMFRELDRE
jgi:ribosomal protein S18 acetylase RimI-like enzyme